MNQADQIHLFVNEFVNQIALANRGLRRMHEFYLWHDKRPGTIDERFTADAKLWSEMQRLRRGYAG